MTFTLSELTNFVIALGTLIAAISALVISWRTDAKVVVTDARLQTISGVVGDVLHATNGMKADLVKATGEAAHAVGTAEGRTAGIAEERAAVAVHATSASPDPAAEVTAPGGTPYAPEAVPFIAEGSDATPGGTVAP